MRTAEAETEQATASPETPVPQRPERVLIMRLGAIGDVLMLLPAVYELHRRGAEVDWLCGRTVAPLLELYPWIRKRIVINDVGLLQGSAAAKAAALAGAWARLAGRRYDLVATIQYDERYRLLTRTTGAKRRLRLVRGWREREILEGRPHSAEYARILGLAPDSFPGENWRPLRPDNVPRFAALAARDERTAGRIALVPAGAKNVLRESALRRWPIERYVELARELVSDGYEVMLTGNEDDQWAAASFHGIAVQNWIGKTTLPELLALYDSCDTVVSHDTGSMHVAGISRAGLVALFGPTNPGNFLPRRHGVVGLWGGARLACRPCYDGRDFAPCTRNGCMEDITPRRVYEAIVWLRHNRDAGTEQDFCWNAAASD